MTRPEHDDPRNLAEAALPPDEIPQYPPTDLPDVNRPDEQTDETTGTDTTTHGDRQHRAPGNEFPGSPVD
jgi:hypothetical protein